MNEIKISIIMPVYKVEDYVGKAIESIQKQTLTDFEFYIVDDGTPDRSGEICDNYAEKDPRLHVIHKENGGAPSARNLAIDLAKGKYLYFMDSDDWVEETMLEDLYNLAEQNQSQLVIAGFYIDTYYKPDKYITSHYIPNSKIYSTKEEFRKEAYKLFDKNMLYPPWNKLFLREYIVQNQLYFPTTFWDDFPFNLSVIRNIERVAVTSKQYYHFLRARADSETAKYVAKMYEKREEEHGWMLELYKCWNICDEASEEMIARRYIDRLIGCIENLTNSNCTLSLCIKRNKVRQMLKSPNTYKCIKLANAKSVYSKIMYLPIKWSNVTLCLWEAKFVSVIKSKSIKIFAYLKAHR